MTESNDPTIMGGWTSDQRRVLTRMHAEGKTRNEVALAVGKTPQDVSDEAGLWGLVFRRRGATAWTAKRIDTLRVLASRGLSREECAAALEVSRAVINNVAILNDIAFLNKRGMWR